MSSDMARSAPRLLLVEDTAVLARTYIQYLADEPYVVRHAATGKAALEELTREPPDLLVLDLVLPDMDGLDILRHVTREKMPCATVVVTAHGSVETAVDAMQAGAADFLAKPITADRLKVTLRNMLERQRLAEIVETYRERIDRDRFQGFVGSSLAMQAVYRMVESAAQSKATVFITGESGTGKEVCAEAIRALGPRADKPFIALNCAAIPRDLMESEIFGHVKGAFTGAAQARDGAATLADGGTLLLDEICDLDLDLQAKLLRFVQSEVFSKVGDSRTIKVDVRLICATNKDPLEEVKAGRFREDLYYRLHVIPIELPPLHARDNDVLAIARHFLERYGAREGKAFRDLAPEVEAAFLTYDWPGNVRQLQNVIQNVVVLHQGETVITEMLPPPLRTLRPAPVIAAPELATAEPVPVRSGDIQELARRIRPLAEIEREAIEGAVALCGGNVRTAAALLGIAPQTIYRKRVQWAGGEGVAAGNRLN
jgi:two-component system, repressor protein LuxO